jgi:hypothetical protein
LLIGERRRVLAGQHVVVALEPVEVAGTGDPHRHFREVQPGRHLAHLLRGDQRLGAGVVEDVLHLGRPQMAVDRGVVQPRPLSGPRDLEEGPVVLHQDGDVVAGTDAPRPQRLGHTRRALVELGVGHHLS